MLRRASFALFVAVTAAVAACGDDASSDGPGLTETDAGTASEGGSAQNEPKTDAGTSTDDPRDAATADADAGPTPEGPTQTGEATYYNAEGLGACGVPFPSDYLVAAINDEQYSKANCGRCVSVTGPKGTVIVRILDRCPGCDTGDLDLSETAFKKIADKSAGRVKISWYFVACPF